MSRFVDTLVATAAVSDRGIVTGEPKAPRRQTWGEIHSQALRMAGALVAGGLAPGSAVAVLAADPALIAPAVHQALRTGHLQILFTAESSADQWGPCPAANVQRSADQVSFDTFQAAFTGQPDVCAPHQHVTADDGAAPLSFGLPDLRSGEAMLAQDAGIVAITAARQADRDADNAADGGIVVRDPYSQVGFIEEMRCTNKVQGASGVIQFSQNADSYGNPIAKPVPIVEIHADGTTRTLPAGPGIAAPTDPAVTC